MVEDFLFCILYGVGGIGMVKELDYRLYLVTDDVYLQSERVFEVIEECLKAGITALQYRAKEQSTREMWLAVQQLKKLCCTYQVPLIINDRLDIALAIDADGLHLGQDDLPLEVARQYFPGKMIGVSATTYAEGQEAILQGADYVGIGPVFTTMTKRDAKPPCGLAVISRLKADFPKARLVAIGGIDLVNASQVVATGADGMAIISAILGASDPADAVCRLGVSWGIEKWT